MKLLILSLTLLFFTEHFTGCSDNVEPEPINIKNFNIDGSFNDRYLFRKEIEREKRIEKRYKKHPFE